MSPDEALERLIQIAPPPDPIPSPAGDWDEFEERNGFPAPPDYRMLIDRYESCGFGWYEAKGSWIHLLDPFDPRESLVEKSEASRQELRWFQRQTPEREPDWPMWPEPAGFLPWAQTVDGDRVGWWTEGPPPSWGTRFHARHGEHREMSVTMSEFLLELLRGEVVPLEQGCPPPRAFPYHREPQGPLEFAQQITLSIELTGLPSKVDPSTTFDEWDQQLKAAGLTASPTSWPVADGEELDQLTFDISFPRDQVLRAKFMVIDLARRLGVRVADVRDHEHGRWWPELSDSRRFEPPARSSNHPVPDHLARPPEANEFRTYPAPDALADAFPRLRPRPAVLLHPFPWKPDPWSSHGGGAVLWPPGEPWPACEAHGSPMVPVLQLLRADVEELGFPEGKDVFVLAWCPMESGPSDGEVAVAHRWLAMGDGLKVIDVEPDLDEVDDGMVPRPSVLFPERIRDFPSDHELSEDDPAEIDRWIDENWEELDTAGAIPPAVRGMVPRYDIHFGAAGGTKIGGYPQWIQEPEHHLCKQCGHDLEYVLSVASTEWDGESWWRWMPIDAAIRPQTIERYERHGSVRAHDEYGLGLMIGDGGNVYVWMCRRCDRSFATEQFT